LSQKLSQIGCTNIISQKSKTYTTDHALPMLNIRLILLYNYNLHHVII